MTIVCTVLATLPLLLEGPPLLSFAAGAASEPTGPFLATSLGPPPSGADAGAKPPGEPASGESKSAAEDGELSLDDLLAKLEHADRDIRDYHANLVYETFDALLDTSERQFGRLVFEMDPSAGRRLAFVFDQYVDGAGRTERDEHRYVFSGSWMCDVDVQRKQFIKRQVVPPDQRFDPLKVGEGPFPLPIGQAAEDVRARFVAAFAPAPTAKLLASLDPNTLHGLRLVPKPGTEAARDFAQIDLYYDRATFMPVAVDATGIEGNRKIVRLSKAVANAGLAADDVALLSIEPPDPGQWTIDIRAWKSEPATP
ncbi:MAG: hypothetical protein KDA22_02875 [Phycisphaerales bacterium]|nr:hypothetical protein [Phycisphaerales bacterium]